MRSKPTTPPSTWPRTWRVLLVPVVLLGMAALVAVAAPSSAAVQKTTLRQSTQALPQGRHPRRGGRHEAARQGRPHRGRRRPRGDAPADAGGRPLPRRQRHQDVPPPRSFSSSPRSTASRSTTRSNDGCRVSSATATRSASASSSSTQAASTTTPPTPPPSSRSRPTRITDTFSSSEITDAAHLQGDSLRAPLGRSEEPCRTATRDVAMRRAYRKCTRVVPARCTSRRLEMPISRHFVQAL